MSPRTKSPAVSVVAVALFLVLPVAAIAQQTVDDALKADNAQGQGTDMLKIAAWIVVFVFLMGGGIVVGARGIMRGMNEGKWGECFANLAFGALLCLFVPLVGWIAGVDLFEMFLIN